MIEFACKHCGKRLVIPDESAGKKGKCPQCGTLVQVPRAAPMSENDIADLLNVDDDVPPPQP